MRCCKYIGCGFRLSCGCDGRGTSTAAEAGGADPRRARAAARRSESTATVLGAEPIADTPGVLMIRPENLALGATAERGEWKGRVTFALHAGPTMEYEVAVGEDTRLRVSRPRAGGAAARTFAVGDDVSVSVVDPGSCRLFPGRRTKGS